MTPPVIRARGLEAAMAAAAAGGLRGCTNIKKKRCALRLACLLSSYLMLFCAALI